MVTEKAGKISTAANSLLDTEFHLHGRKRETGLDCIGLVKTCLESAGITGPAPNGYSVRGGDADQVRQYMESAGFQEVTNQDDLQDGDLVLVLPSPIQMHLMVFTISGFVHAHAGLRKVVLSPGPSPWPIKHIFRISEL